MAQQSHLPKISVITASSKDEFCPCRTTIFIMQFLRSLFSKNKYILLNSSKEVFLTIIIIFFHIFYPNTVFAGIFSFLEGDKASAKTFEVQNTPNLQNMTILRAVVNTNPHPDVSASNYFLASENALVAEIGPAGTASEIDIPTNTEISMYVVRSGDTVSQIAKMFDVSVNTIIWANNLSSSPVLREGQTLVILPITGIRYVVKKGDKLQSIANAHKADLTELLQYNDLRLNSLIAVGDIIIIPDAEPTALASANRPNVARNPTSPLRNANGPTLAGYFMRPISGGHKSQGLHGNNGVDIAAPVRTPIYAAASGRVIASMTNNAWNGGYGNYVIISHEKGVQTLYAHTRINTVSVGQAVKKGDKIAEVGMTGKTTGAHLHFEVRGAQNPF